MATRKKKPFSVLVLCHEFPPIGGGAGMMANLLCKGLQKSKAEIRVWTNHPNQTLPDFPFEIEYFPSPRKARFSTNFWAMMSFIFQCSWKAIRNRNTKPDWILSTMAIPSGISGWIISKLWGAPHGIWFLGSDVHAGKESGPGFIQAMLLKFLWKRSQKNFFASNSLRNIVDPHKKIPNALVLPMATTFRNRSQPTRKKSKLIVFAARLDPVKNPGLFLEGVKMFNKWNLGLNVKFQMVGSGKLLEELKEKYSFETWENFTYMDSIPHKKMPELYREAYAIVLTSKMEGFPLNVLEAGRYKTPCIGANTSGLNEVIEDKVTGLLFKSNDPKDLAIKIRYLCENPRKRRSLGEKALLQSNKYTPENTAKVFRNAVESVMV